MLSTCVYCSQAYAGAIVLTHTCEFTSNYGLYICIYSRCISIHFSTVPLSHLFASVLRAPAAKVCSFLKAGPKRREDIIRHGRGQAEPEGVRGGDQQGVGHDRVPRGRRRSRGVRGRRQGAATQVLHVMCRRLFSILQYCIVAFVLHRPLCIPRRDILIMMDDSVIQGGKEAKVNDAKNKWNIALLNDGKQAADTRANIVWCIWHAP